MNTTLIHNASIVNEGNVFKGSLLIENDLIGAVIPASAEQELPRADTIVEAEGLYLLPGIIDDHVHFREPGLTHKATIESEGRAAVAGGVTTVFDMPNNKPVTTTKELLEQKYDIAAETCLANHSFYLGATTDNLKLIESLDPDYTCGIKLFMGSSTGNMLLSDDASLTSLFSCTPMLIAAHCEETPIIDRNMAYWTKRLGQEPPVEYHPLIRSEEACYASSAHAIELADRAGARLHVMHISTARELALFTPGHVSGKKITAEACPAHLCFTDQDYKTLGTRIKCNPSVKTAEDRQALREGVMTHKIDVIGTDHAPHVLSEKQGGCKSAASGMPMLPYSLPAMLDLVSKGVFGITDIVQKMCHNPAALFGIRERGYIRPGYKADLTLASMTQDIVTAQHNMCGWHPMQDMTLNGKVHYTWVNGNLVYAGGQIRQVAMGERVKFDR